MQVIIKDLIEAEGRRLGPKLYNKPLFIYLKAFLWNIEWVESEYVSLPE